MSSRQFFSAAKLLQLIAQHDDLTTIADAVLAAEHELTSRQPTEIRANMAIRLTVMRDAISQSLHNPARTKSTLSGGDAKRMHEHTPEHNFLSPVMHRATQYALAVMETNARMGKIVAAPTAGSAGIVPGGIIALQEEWHMTEDQCVDGLLTSAGIGIIIAHNATFSAAKGGCQAEVGVSTAMCSAALSAMRGLSPERCLNSASLALKNMLGLACDPIAGLVEAPCVKRNAIGVAHAMTSAEMSAAGITSNVPFDEVVEAMNNVAANMHANIRETSKGGLAVTPTGKRITKMIFGKNLGTALAKDTPPTAEPSAQHSCHYSQA